MTFFVGFLQRFSILFRFLTFLLTFSVLYVKMMVNFNERRGIMFCSNCGSEVAENAIFCGKCGARINNDPPAEENAVNHTATISSEYGQPVVPPYGGQGDQQTFRQPSAEVPPLGYDTFAPQTADSPVTIPGPAKPKRKSGKTLISIVAAVAVLAGAFFIFRDPVSDFFARTFMSDSQYFSYVNKADLRSASDSFGDIYSNICKNTSTNGTSVSVDAELTDAGKDMIRSLTDSSEMIDWIDKLSITGDMNVDGTDIGYDLGAKLNGKELLNANVAISDNKLYLSIPELADEALAMDLYGGGYGSADFALREFETLRDDILKKIPNEKTAEKLINKYIDIALKNIKRVEKEKDTLAVNGISQNCRKYTARIDSETAYTICTDLIRAIKDDRDIRDIIESLAEIDSLDIDINDFYEAIEETLDEIDTDDFEKVDEMDLAYACWVSSNGDVIARSLTADGRVMFYGTAKQGKKFATAFGFGREAFEENTSLFLLSGDGVCRSDKYSGKFKLYVDGRQRFGFETEDFDVGRLKKGEFSGKIIIPIGDALNALGELDDDFERYAALFNSYSISMEMDTHTKGTSTFSLSLDNGKDELAVISAKGSLHNGKSVKVPDRTVDDADDWAESINTDKLSDALKKAGAPSDITDSLDDLTYLLGGGGTSHGGYDGFDDYEEYGYGWDEW